MTSRNVLFSAAMTLAIVLSFSACGLQTGGILGEGGGGGTPEACTNDDHCDDSNPCTVDTCDVANGVCFPSKAVPDASLPLALQTAGDCATLVCKGGVRTTEMDDHDFLVDDSDCTVDQCTNGKPLHAVEPDGSTCLINAANGTCKAGACVVECGAGKPPCDDMEPCTTDACDVELGACTFITLVDGAATPGSTPKLGDCKVDVCVGGKAATVNDDSDTPSASGDCQIGKCTAGVPSAEKFAPDTACNTNGGKVCDGDGACVACNAPAQCGPTNECQTSECTNHACVITFAPVSTPVAAQVMGDCKQNVCDGAGKTIVINDDMDTQGDGNSCTDDVCVAGSLQHNNSAIDTACGVTLVCNGMGSCVGCTMNAQCNGPETCGGCGVAGVCCCKPKTCGELGLKCGSAPDGCGNTLDCNNGKDNGETDADCGGPSCSVKCAQAKVCVNNSDCAGGFCADGRCCDGACNTACVACNLMNLVGTCSPIVSGVDNSPANICNGTSACDPGGACKKVNGQGCAADTDCVSGACADGVCCNVSCTGQCKSCNVAGSPGVCSNVPSGVADNNANVMCNGSNVCDGAGACKKVNATACAAGNECLSGNCVDGVCCNGACGTTCQACNLAGTMGLCTNIPSGQTDNVPMNACNGNNVCNGGNGANACKKINSTGCGANAECLSNFCVDGVCCNAACGGACRSCNLNGTVGTCSNITSGTDNVPAGICVAPNACDAGGACKKANGQGCVANADCVSGACVDGTCCSVASCGSCQACTGAGGTCVNIVSGQPDNVPAGTCSGNNLCDGVGGCKVKNGVNCAGGGAGCLSGVCADGLCCDSACSTLCKSCSLAATMGTCTSIANGSDPDNECPGTSCNGAGACVPKQGNGTGCANANQCNSNFCVDGVCCNALCDTACFSCNQPAGKLGVCSALTSVVDNNPANICNGTKICDAAGACKNALGTMCAAPTDCASGFCADGVCCNAVCTGTCLACDSVATLGTCSNVAAGFQDNNATATCTGTSACDGVGGCKSADGQICAVNGDCANAHCVDGVCCNSTCVGTCRACSMALKGAGADGVCDFIMTGTDPENECNAGTPNCNGAGVCQ